MHSTAIRKAFLEYFSARGHQLLKSSSLVPAGDASLLFTNAGMVQFKDVFLGRAPAVHRRVCSAQRCLRAGGKHNDLENVGYTARHHTFFEMLGNFSFGDYFKKEAIAYAWEFLTGADFLGLEPKRLWITVFGGGQLFGAEQPEVPADEEAYAAWMDILQQGGFSKKEAAGRITRVKGFDNFWMMGDSGPCGPCSEIFYGREGASRFAGNDPGQEDSCPEIWNLVFMQYSREQAGKLEELPAPCVDTGMGLERIAAVMQGVQSNYEIDLFQALMAAVNDSAVADGGDDCGGDYGVSHQVIADHIRAAAFLISDGVHPGNEGRGYVLRRIIRRAARHGRRLGAKAGFFARLAGPLAQLMGDAALDLARNQAAISKVLAEEEEQFARTLEQGLQRLEQETRSMKKGDCLPGELVFFLYDSCGFPVDMTADIAREQELEVDLKGFEAAMAQQQARARAASAFGEATPLPAAPGETAFLGYRSLSARGRVVGLWRGQQPAERLAPGEEGDIALDTTPFYAEGGGQVGDSGTLTGPGGTFQVGDTQKSGEVHLHRGLAQGEISLGDEIQAKVDAPRRQAITRNHSATHLLHAALRKVLGTHVVQQGSLVEPARLRFDFSHPQALTAGQLAEVEQAVNREICRNTQVRTELMSRQEAENRGAIAMFGEKYKEQVRVLSMGDDFSVEFCGGTHARQTGDIGPFKIVTETGVAAGVRRVEALSGEAASLRFAEGEALLEQLGRMFGTRREELVQRLQRMQEEGRRQQRQLEEMRLRLAEGSGGGGSLVDGAVPVGPVQVLAKKVELGESKALRTAIDRCREQLGQAVVLLATERDGELLLAAGVSKDLVQQVSAAELMREFAGRLGGRGGGRVDFAQGGGTDKAALEQVLSAVPAWVGERLGSEASP